MNPEIEGLADRLLAGDISLEDAVKLLERSMIGGALEACKGNRSAASKKLKIHRNTLQRKISEYELGTRRTRRKPAARAGSVRRRKTGTS